MKPSFSPEEGLKGISFLVNEECMSRSLLEKIESQCSNIDYYHKFIITDTKRDCSNHYILETLLNFLDPIPISPVYCRSQPKECYFLANDCLEAVMAIVNNQCRIPNPKNPDNPFDISIFCNFFYAATIDNRKIGNLQNILQQRFNKETKTLNLSELFKDEDLVEYCPLSFPKVMLQVMSVVNSKICPVNINLQNNYLKDVNSIYPLNKVEVESLDLSNNEISSLEDLEILKHFYNLKALNLDGNPICSNYDSYNYVLDIKSICKNLEILDNHQLLSPPKYRKTFVCQPEAKFFVSQFLEHFFTVYDSDDRANIAYLYAKDAIFSVTSEVIPDRDNSDPIDLSHYGLSQPFAVQGYEDILKVYEDFPKTRHDQFSFVCDVTLYEPTFVALSVRGIFRENKEIMAFDRHFLIKRNDDEFLIINEQLMIQNVNKERASWYFTFPTPHSYLPYSMEQYETLEMVTQQLTTMNRKFCNKLLDHCQYDLKKALDLFCNLYLRNDIPQEAYIPDNPSGHKSELRNGTVIANTVWRTLRGESLVNLPENDKPTNTCITKMFRTPFPVNRDPFSNYIVETSGKVVKKLTNDGKQKTELKETGQLNNLNKVQSEKTLTYLGKPGQLPTPTMCNSDLFTTLQSVPTLPTLTVPQSQIISDNNEKKRNAPDFCDIQMIFRNIIAKILQDTSGIKLLPGETGLINELSDYIKAYFDTMKNNSACRREDIPINVFKLKNSCQLVIRNKIFKTCRSLVHVIIHEYVENSNCSNTDNLGNNHIGICYDPIYRDYNKTMLNSIMLRLKEVEADLKPQIPKFECSLAKKETDVAGLDSKERPQENTVRKSDNIPEKVANESSKLTAEKSDADHEQKATSVKALGTAVKEKEVVLMEETGPVVKILENEPSQLILNKPDVGTLQTASDSTEIKAVCDIQIIFRNIIEKILQDTSDIKTKPLLRKETGLINELSDQIKAYFDAMKNNSAYRREDFVVNIFQLKNSCGQAVTSKLFKICRGLVHVIIHEYVENSNCSNTNIVLKNFVAICKDPIYRDYNKKMLNSITLHLKEVEADLKPQIPRFECKLVTEQTDVAGVCDIQIIFRNLITKIFQHTTCVKLLTKEIGLINEFSDHIRAYFDAMKKNSACRRDDFFVNVFQLKNKIACHPAICDTMFKTCRSLVHVIFHEYVENSNCSNTNDAFGTNYIGICWDPIYRDKNKRMLNSITLHLKEVETDLKAQIPKFDKPQIPKLECSPVKKQPDVAAPKEHQLPPLPPPGDRVTKTQIADWSIKNPHSSWPPDIRQYFLEKPQLWGKKLPLRTSDGQSVDVYIPFTM